MVMPWCFSSRENAHRNIVEIFLSVHLLCRTRTTAIYSDMLRLVRRLLIPHISNWRLLYWPFKLEYICQGYTQYTDGEFARGRSFLLHAFQVMHVFQYFVGMNYWWWLLVSFTRSRIVRCAPLLILLSNLPKMLLWACLYPLGVVCRLCTIRWHTHAFSAVVYGACSLASCHI